MRRIRDNKENESMENAREAYDRYSRQKHSRDYVRKYEEQLEKNLEKIVSQIADESWIPQGYKEKIIFDRKRRKLAKAPIEDHVIESATILPYEKALYDHSTWRAPAVKPGLGTHGLFRMLRNELFNNTQEEMMHYVTLDAHHYFPRMDHCILKKGIDDIIKKGKLRKFMHKVVDSYYCGAPLGIKVAQIFGQIYLAGFDRKAMRFFDIGKDPDKLAYWTQRYVTGRILTAKTARDFEDLCRGPTYLAEKFRGYVRNGIKHYFRFVDNILIIHADKTALHIINELVVMHLARDYHVMVNKDYNIRPCWTGIRLAGYVFYNDHVMSSKRNKTELAKRVHNLKKKGFEEEGIRLKLASRFGYIKHANSRHLFRTLGMEKTLGRIINNRRVRPPFSGMAGSQKVKFSSIINPCAENTSGTDEHIKIYLMDYKIIDSKIDSDKYMVQIENSDGGQKLVEKTKPQKALAIKFKRILRTFENDDGEHYIFEKKKDDNGAPTADDAEYYSFTGSKILIDQALNDFTIEDLPCPTVIQQFRGKNGQTFVKFT